MAVIYRSTKKIKSSPRERSVQLRQIRQEIYRLLGERSSGIGSFVVRPPQLYFETQMSGEKTVLLLRRHWITNVKWWLTTLLMLIAPFFLGDLPPFSLLPTRFGLVIGMMWYLFVFAFVLEQAFTWYFNVSVITDERVIDIDFISLIHKRVSDAEIEKIEDVTYKMGGILGTMFDFGTIYIQTAGERPEFEFEEVPKPALVVKVLQELRLEEKQETLEGRLN